MQSATQEGETWLPSIFRRGGELSQEAVFDILRNRRRRYALHYLKQQEAPVGTRELVEQVAAWENDTTVSELSSRERHRVYVSMTQSHLPKMVKEDIIRIEEKHEDEIIRLTEQAANLDIYLEVIPENDIEWPQFYTGVAVVNAGLLALASLNLPVVSQAPDGLWMLAVAVVFLLAALVHNWFHRKGRLGTEGPPPN
jgi:hypothetical protein